MTYFKKLSFNASNGKLSFHKLIIFKGQLQDDGIQEVDLKMAPEAMQRIEISKEQTALGEIYSYSVNPDEIQSGVYLFKTGFGFIDSNAPNDPNLFPLCFGRFLEVGSIGLEETLFPQGAPIHSITGQQGKFGCLIGEIDVDQLPPMPPMVVVMEDIKLYIGLEEKEVVGTKTYYDIKLQRVAIEV